MLYNKEEINSLKIYSSRKSYSYDYEEINLFLKFISNPNDLYKRIYMDYTKIRKILKSIEKLYSLCCKYGKNHEIPNIIYRQEHHFNDIIKHTNINTKQWISKSFLSFTKSLCEIDRFRFNENARLITATINNRIKSKKIPFIDVTDILGEDKYQEDEQEILIPPFTLIELPHLNYNMKILSDDYINLQKEGCESYEEVLEEFIMIYKDCTCDLKQLDNSRKKLNELFSKKLLKEKSRIMM